MSIKNIRNEIYGNKKNIIEPLHKTTNEIMNVINESDEEDEKNIWKPSSMDIKNIKKVIESLNEDPEQWQGENKKDSTKNLSDYIDDICDKLHNEQVEKDDSELFN